MMTTTHVMMASATVAVAVTALMLSRNTNTASAAPGRVRDMGASDVSPEPVTAVREMGAMRDAAAEQLGSA